jgi:hypothetical protein
MNMNDDPRALRQAQNAETQRIRRANCSSLEEEYNHRCARRVIPGVQEHKSAQWAAARDDGVTREHESAQRAAARDDGVTSQNKNNQRRARRIIPGVREHESAQRLAARDKPGVREYKAAQQSAARDEPGVREHESAQRAATRKEPGVREHESEQRAAAREEPGVWEHESEQQAAAREDIGGTSMSEDRSNEAPNQNCVICLRIIDVNDCRSSMRTQCNHIFHRDCLERWMEEKVRFWFGLSYDGEWTSCLPKKL